MIDHLVKLLRVMSIRIRTLVLTILAAPLASADIYRCQAKDGTWQFTDRQCTDGAGQKVNLSPLLTIKQPASAGLSEAELQALITLDEKMAKSRELHDNRRKKKARQRRKNNNIKQQNCVLAVRRLEEIQEKRSHGYRLSETTPLNQQTRKFESIRRSNCGQ